MNTINPVLGRSQLQSNRLQYNSPGPAQMSAAGPSFPPGSFPTFAHSGMSQIPLSVGGPHPGAGNAGNQYINSPEMMKRNVEIALTEHVPRIQTLVGRVLTGMYEFSTPSPHTSLTQIWLCTEKTRTIRVPIHVKQQVRLII